MSASRKAGRVGLVLRLAAAMLAVAGQVGTSGASLTLARDESSAISHTEQGGVDLHHGHNEATCATCIALSLQGTPAHASASLEGSVVAGSVPACPAGNFIAPPQLLPNSCRAPPREA